MRIISKFKDYYDGVQAMAFDPSIVYVRTTSEIELTSHHRHYYSRNEREFAIVGFCGEIYILGRVVNTDRWLIDVDELIRSMPPTTGRWAPNLRNEWDGEVRYSRKHTALFSQHNVPIFVIRNDFGCRKVLTLNPLLREYDFARVKDPYTAFTSLQNYVGGVLNHKPMPTPPISDEVMAEIKGFDKWSFRKEPRAK